MDQVGQEAKEAVQEAVVTGVEEDKAPFERTQSLFGQIVYAPIESIESLLPASIQQSISKLFPLSECRDRENPFFHTLHSGISIPTDQQSVREWVFYGGGKGQKAVITSTMLLFEYPSESFVSFDDFHERFSMLVNAFARAFNHALVGRVGLRSVNLIVDGWRDYLDPRYIANIEDLSLGNCLRAVSYIETKMLQSRQRIQYGLPNRTYPAQDAIGEFMLDIDTFEEHLFRLGDASMKMMDFHALAEMRFSSFFKGLKWKW